MVFVEVTVNLIVFVSVAAWGSPGTVVDSAVTIFVLVVALQEATIPLVHGGLGEAR